MTEPSDNDVRALASRERRESERQRAIGSPAPKSPDRFTNMNPEYAIEQLVLERLAGQLARVGCETTPQESIDAVRSVLNAEELTSEEHASLEEHALDESADAMAIVIGERIERALRAGFLAAGMDDTVVIPETEVVVVRAQDKAAEGKQLASVLNKLRSSMAKRMKGEGGGLLLIAANQLYKKVKQLVPKGGGGMPSVDFHEEGPRERPSTTAIEIVPADVHLEALERKASVQIEKLRKDSTSADSMRAAWVAADEDSLALEDFETDVEPHSEDRLSISDLDTTPANEDTAPANPNADPMIGKLFHLKYRIVRRIGKGGFGSVYEARDERGAGNRVAIKILSGAAAESAAQQQSFKDEAKRVTKLSHPNVVDWKVFDETEEGLPYFVMELVEGEEFEDTLRRDRKIEADRAARLLLQILDALRAAHHLSKKESVLHLDLKPANLFRVPPRHGRDEQIKVIDFGIGQYIGDEEVENAAVLPNNNLSPGDVSGPSTLSFNRPQGYKQSTSSGVTRTKGCTPEYASPEQVDHVMYKEDIVALDGRSDLYSLGVVAFEMLTGQLPFKAKSRLDVLRMHQEDPAPRVGSMGVKVPRKLAVFVDRCLQKDRDKR